jgi:hypothetical protein
MLDEDVPAADIPPYPVVVHRTSVTDFRTCPTHRYRATIPSIDLWGLSAVINGALCKVGTTASGKDSSNEGFGRDRRQAAVHVSGISTQNLCEVMS